MSLIKYLYNVFIESVFPLSSAEVELFSYSPEKAYLELKKSEQLNLTNADSIFSYKDERVKKLIWNIKYKKSEKALKIASYALYQELKSKFSITKSYKIILIPIPISKRRLHERGFNQCEIILKEFKLLDIENFFEIKNDILIRAQHTSRQTLKNRDNRLQDSKGIFLVNEKALIEIRSSQENFYFIVIDDVITTGSTMKEALQTLENSGLKNVSGISLAH